MNRFAYSTAVRSGAIVACVAATGLTLAACGGGTGPSSPGSAGSSTTKSSSSGGSGNSGSGSSSVVSSNSVPFPIAVGNTWVYSSSVPLTGTTSTVTNKVLSVTPVSGGNQVTMSNTNSLGGGTADSTFIFHSDGSITYPSSQLGSAATIVKGAIVWPSAAVVDSGQSTTSTVEIALGAGTSKTLTAHLTVKGDGTATVTEPAGTYSATIVQMTEAFTVLGHSGTVTVKSWMANGVGPVQSQAVIEELGHTEIVSQLKLVSFKQG
jgi:hypothetical protein